MLAALPLGQAARPNVILVMTDDQGYPELSAHGNPVLNTPFLDRLHSQSVRFTDYHASPMCTPTRGSLMTGLDPARNGAINVSSGRTLLRANLPTMADLLREQGYRTGIFGKWHLGDNYPYRPQDRGFEETLWFPSSHIGSVPDHWGNNYFDDTYRWNGKRKKFTGYCTDIFFDHAIDWIKRSAVLRLPADQHAARAVHRAGRGHRGDGGSGDQHQAAAHDAPDQKQPRALPRDDPKR